MTTRYEDSGIDTNAGKLFGYSFLIIALLAIVSVWIPELRQLSGKLFNVLVFATLGYFLLFGVFGNFMRWLTSENK